MPAPPRSPRERGEDLRGLLRFRRGARFGTVLLLVSFLLAGCSVFDTKAAREVTRERLVELADAGHADHMQYVGSDGAWHYVLDTRPERMRPYKIRADQIKLQDTFDVGQDEPYVLHADVIEGQRLGTKPQN